MYSTKLIFKIFLCFSLISFALACGSSSGSDQAIIRVVSPETDTSFAAGSNLDFEIETINFTLKDPTVRTFVRHGDEDHGDSNTEHGDTEHESELPVEDHNESDPISESADNNHNDHDHNSNDTNPTAKEGHYHVYLNDAQNTDSHLTLWNKQGTFTLPQNLSAGTHSLRFELRDNNHVRLGTATSEAILFFKIQ